SHCPLQTLHLLSLPLGSALALGAGSWLLHTSSPWCLPPMALLSLCRASSAWVSWESAGSKARQARCGQLDVLPQNGGLFHHLAQSQYLPASGS
uniref:Uncharacterized protein n=1 Tax=Buteo japonicus TaxID=224669 RepID=A0A8B9ZA49_9AVES